MFPLESICLSLTWKKKIVALNLADLWEVIALCLRVDFASGLENN